VVRHTIDKGEYFCMLAHTTNARWLRREPRQVADSRGIHVRTA